MSEHWSMRFRRWLCSWLGHRWYTTPNSRPVYSCRRCFRCERFEW